MEILLNSVDLDEIIKMYDTKLISGITTNPKLISESNVPFEKLVKTICSTVSCPVSVQVISRNTKEMLKEALYISGIAENIVIKIPATYEGFIVAAELKIKKIPTNITLCYSLPQVLLGSIVDAKYISIFLGNMLDAAPKDDPTKLIKDAVTLVAREHKQSKILAASIRTIDHFLKAVEAGVHCITTDGKVIKQIATNELSENGLSDFIGKWETSNQKQHFSESCKHH